MPLRKASYWTFLIQILEFTEAIERACPGPHKAEQSQYVTPAALTNTIVKTSPVRAREDRRFALLVTSTRILSRPPHAL